MGLVRKRGGGGGEAVVETEKNVGVEAQQTHGIV